MITKFRFNIAWSSVRENFKDFSYQSEVDEYAKSDKTDRSVFSIFLPSPKHHLASVPNFSPESSDELCDKIRLIILKEGGNDGRRFEEEFVSIADN